jgi:hypothetical protein
MKPEGYKRAYYRSIPAYFNTDTNDIMGRNWFYDVLIEINLWVDVHIVGVQEFPILIEE